MINCGSIEWVRRNIEWAQKDGSQPTVLTVGSGPGESGIAVMRYRFTGGKYCSYELSQHAVFIHLSSPTHFEVRMAGELLEFEARKGSAGICPAGTDCEGHADGDVEGLVVAVAPGVLSLAAAEDGILEAKLVHGVQNDFVLLSQAEILAAECSAGYPNGPLYWDEAARNFIESILARHTANRISQTRGSLGKEAFAKLRDYICSNLDRPIDIGALANIAGRSPFHFSRVFTRSVGVTPHRYVVHLRLQRAIDLARAGNSSFAEIAVRTGFADQSHLSRWVRRVHGVSLRHFAA